MKNHFLNTSYFLPVVVASMLYFPLSAQPITGAGIDSIVALSMKTFDVPGIAVAVVSNGSVVHARGYGVRSVKTREKTDENTLFGIASNSKAFTAAALGMLVDEGTLKWDDRVIDHIPEFRLYNPYVTEEFTIRDLLTHRSGLGLGAGDLMIWPDSARFSREEIMHNLRYLKPVSGFRTRYDYDNNLYIVAGEVVARASGMSWEEFVEKKIMQPLGMNASAASFSRLNDRLNVIDAHVRLNGRLQVVDKYLNTSANAAAGIYSNISDMSKWVMMQLNKGKYGEQDGEQLFSERVHHEMWTPQTIIPVRGSNLYNTHFMSYGLGWRLSDVYGFLQASHTGGLLGIVTQVTLIPELKLGMIVLTNQQSSEAFYAITNTIKDSYLGIPGRDWISEMTKQLQASETEARRITDEIQKELETQRKGAGSKTDKDIYTGTYKDDWFGEIAISVKHDRLWFESAKSPKLHGEMDFYKGNTFVVQWADRSLEADAFVIFTLDHNGRSSGIRMKAVSPLTDFSYDFQDLDFRRIK